MAEAEVLVNGFENGTDSTAEHQLSLSPSGKPNPLNLSLIHFHCLLLV